MQQNFILNIFFRFLFLYDIFIYFQQHFYTSFYKYDLPLPQKKRRGANLSNEHTGLNGETE